MSYARISPHNWPTALQTSHTAHFVSRFNTATPAKAGIQLLYLAEDHIVALYEVGALLGSPLTGEKLPIRIRRGQFSTSR